MNILELERHIEIVDDIIMLLKPSRVLSFDMLQADLKYYKSQHSGLNRQYRNAWETAFYNRIVFLNEKRLVPTRVSKDFQKLLHSWNASVTRGALRIFFGQQRVAPSFQSARSVGQDSVLGFPDIVGKRLDAVAQSIAAGDILPDSIPIKIFFNSRINGWITKNNRGFTAFCMSRVMPLRIMPEQPTQDELNRLNEREGIDQIGPYIFNLGIARPHSESREIPSRLMFITNGSNTWNVEKVVTVPSHFV